MKTQVINIINKIMNIGIKKILFGLLIIIAVLGIGVAYNFYDKYQKITKDQNIEVKKETDALVKAVGRLIELPTNETPTVATITDIDKLANQSFFMKGENGDRLLAYSMAKTAILYRPSTGKIINVAPITVNEPSISTQNIKKGGAGHIHRVAYLNGTDTAGKGYLAEKLVLEKYPDTYKTVAIANAVKKDYEGVLVVDLSGDHADEVLALAKLLGGSVGKLPSSEVTPDADILVISGK